MTAEVQTPAGTLHCTLDAWDSIGKAFGNFTEAYRQLADLNPAAYVKVVSAGAGIPEKEARQTVFEAGLPDLIEPMARYLTMLVSGGKLPEGAA